MGDFKQGILHIGIICGKIEPAIDLWEWLCIRETKMFSKNASENKKSI